MAIATTTAILLGLAAAGAGTQVVGQVKRGNAARKAGEIQADIGRDARDLEYFNANVSEQLAQDAIARGRDDEQRFRQGVRTLIGSQRAGFAAQGVDVGVGSPVDVVADAAFLGELDALTVRSNAEREAYGHGIDADNARRRGDIALKEGRYAAAEGRSAQNASRWNAAGTILGATAQGYSLLAQKYGWGLPNQRR